jgi:hypothetical protein
LLQLTPQKKSVDQAIKNLERFTLIGDSERLDLFREEFKRKFGVRLSISHANRNPATELKKKALATPEIRKN